MTLSELSEQTDVATRRIRSYIKRGLLPRPHTGGRWSTYSSSHLDRLRIVNWLRNQGLSLAEISVRLRSLEPSEVEQLARAVVLQQADPEKEFPSIADRPSEGAARPYLRLIEQALLDMNAGEHPRRMQPGEDVYRICVGEDLELQLRAPSDRPLSIAERETLQRIAALVEELVFHGVKEKP